MEWLTGLSVALLLSAGAFIAGRLWPPRPRDVAWLAGRVDPPDDEARVVRRYLRRHRVHRLVGGTVGVLAALVAAARWGSAGDLTVAMFWGIAGTLAGALSAESYRLGPAGGRALASLEPHAPPVRHDVVVAARCVLAVAAVLAAVTWVWGGRPAAAGAVLAGGAVATVAELTRARIVGRRRPVLSERARALDARIRAFAAESVAWLELSAAVLVGTAALTAVPLGRLSFSVRLLVGLSGLVVAIVLLHRAAPRPRRGWRPTA